MKAPKIFMVSFLYIVYEHLLAFRGPTRSGHYGGMILAKSPEDFNGFFLYIVYGRLFAFRDPTRRDYYGGMIPLKVPKMSVVFFLFIYLQVIVRFSRSDTHWPLWRDDPR